MYVCKYTRLLQRLGVEELCACPVVEGAARTAGLVHRCATGARQRAPHCLAEILTAAIASHRNGVMGMGLARAIKEAMGLSRIPGAA